MKFGYFALLTLLQICVLASYLVWVAWAHPEVPILSPDTHIGHYDSHWHSSPTLFPDTRTWVDTSPPRSPTPATFAPSGDVRSSPDPPPAWSTLWRLRPDGTPARADRPSKSWFRLILSQLFFHVHDGDASVVFFRVSCCNVQSDDIPTPKPSSHGSQKNGHPKEVPTFLRFRRLWDNSPEEEHEGGGRTHDVGRRASSLSSGLAGIFGPAHIGSTGSGGAKSRSSDEIARNLDLSPFSSNRFSGFSHYYLALI